MVSEEYSPMWLDSMRPRLTYCDPENILIHWHCNIGVDRFVLLVSFKMPLWLMSTTVLDS